MEFTLTTHSGMAAVLDALVQTINNEAGTTCVAAASREDSLLALRIENLLEQASTALATNAAFEFCFGDQRVHLQRDPKGIVRVGAQTPI